MGATLLVAVGCTAADPVGTGPPTGSTTGAPHMGGSPSPAATPQALDPSGSADDNLAYFAVIVSQVWGGPDRASGRAYVDALAAAGFDKAAMQVTQDETTLGDPAESIQFSVRWRESCLVGQVGPATGDPVAVVLPAVGGGTCLIGKTRPIDW